MTLPFGEPFETILIVEDRPALLKFVKQVLEEANFSVIAAGSVKQAMRLEAEFPGTIDLLLSDVKLKSMSGPELAKRLTRKRPQMRTMLMSGYAGGAMLLLNYGWHYAEKPAVAAALVSKLKETLRGEAHEQSRDRLDTFKGPRRPFGRATLRYRPAAPARARRGA